jgi:hypothetical protein
MLASSTLAFAPSPFLRVTQTFGRLGVNMNWVQQWDDDDLTDWLKSSYPAFVQQPELFIRKYSVVAKDVKYKNYDLGAWMFDYHEHAQQSVQWTVGIRPCFQALSTL